jgi:hypothetical protein
LISSAGETGLPKCAQCPGIMMKDIEPVAIMLHDYDTLADGT